MPVVSDPAALGGTGPLLGLDLGTRTIGVAVSDPGRRVAAAVTTLRRTRLAEDLATLARMAESRGVYALVIGLPLNMSGAGGRRAQSVRTFARAATAATGLPVALWDERLSTVAAQRALAATGVNRQRQPALIDGAAAAYILQGALDRLRGLHG